MTSPIIPGSAQQDLEGRSVRDIVEYSPEQVDDAWCRKILRKILQSLELQYAMQMPHRVITPDTVVFHANGEPLLISHDIDAAPAPDARLTDDLTALARVLHYAITQELTPTGPLHGRAPGYSDALVVAVDACMAPDPAQRPHDVAAVRALLGVVAPPAGAITLSDAPALAPPQAAVQLGKPQSKTNAQPGLPSVSSAGTHDVADPDATVLSGISVAATTATPAPAERTAPIIAAAAEAAAAGPRIPHKPSAPDRAPDVPLVTGPFAGIGPAPAGARPHPGMNRGQRWAISAGAAAIMIAIALALFAELRDAGSYDHIVLTLPQTGAGAQPGLPAPDGGATTAARADRADAGAPLTPTGAATGYAADNLAHAATNAATNGARTGTATGAASRIATEATPAPTASQPANLAGSSASGASTGGTTLGGGREQADDITRSAPNAANEDASAAAAGLALGNASYQLQIKPWGIVYVDGVDRGVSPPVKRLALTPGRHTIRITNPNYRDSVLEFDSAQATSNGKIIVDFNHEAQ